MPKIGWQSDLHGKMNLNIWFVSIDVLKIWRKMVISNPIKSNQKKNYEDICTTTLDTPGLIQYKCINKFVQASLCIEPLQLQLTIFATNKYE